MLGKNNLETQVDKYLRKQATLDLKRKHIIDLFNEQYSKKEVKSFVDYLLQNSADIYSSDLHDFIKHYESEDKNAFTVNDIKIYISLLKVHKRQMKEPKKQHSDLNTSRNENELAEGSNE